MILVVDDNQSVRRVIQRRLFQAGYEVAEARDGAEALERYRQEPADLVITDLVMPGQDGQELITNLRLEFPNVRIVAISGYPGDGLEEAALRGAVRTLAKPFTTAELLETVQHALANVLS